MIKQMSQLIHSWLLLLHQIPPNPPYRRAKVLRRLNQLGALAIKNSAYVLPETDETMEDMQWVRSEILEEEGKAWLFRVEALGGLSNESLANSFRATRGTDYKQLLELSTQLWRSIQDGGGNDGEHEPELRKLKRRFEDVRRIDFFDAPGREELTTIMETIDRTLHGPVLQPVSKPDLNKLKGRTWVTRHHVKVDRISTAWLIRRFVDPAARLRFVDPEHYTPAESEIRFDMFEGEFTHEGDLCTFEALLRHAKLRDPGLAAIAEIVHDIDLKDEKYQRPETSGVAAMISGIVALHATDEQRVDEGGRLLNATYAALRASQAAER